MAKKEKKIKIVDNSSRTYDEKKSFLHKILVMGSILFLVLLIGVLIAGSFFDHPLLKMPREMLGKAFAPIQEVFSSTSSTISEYFRSLKYRSNLEYEYELLLKKVEELQDASMLADEYKHQRDTYADMVEDMKRNEELDPIYADVIGHDTANYFSVLNINRGTKQGVENNMAVVFGGGLVGYTYDVKESSAKVKTIIDSDCSIPALLESSRDQGIVTGTMAVDGKPNCRMYYISDNHLPRTGDLVVTSGVGIEFLKGVPIGTVRESTRGLEDNKQYVVIEPIVDFAHIEYVTIYRYKPSYAEDAVGGEQVEAPDFVVVPTARPIPTFAVGIGTSFDQGKTKVDENVTPSPSPSPSPTPSPTIDPNLTPRPDNLAYQRPESGTPTPPPMSTPKPTDTPAPTFNPDSVTVEEDE